MTQHIHAEHIIAAANDTTVQWQLATEQSPNNWTDFNGHPSFLPALLYRQKPKPPRTVDLYLWVLRNDSGNWVAVPNMFSDADYHRSLKNYPDRVYRRLDYTKLTVEATE